MRRLLAACSALFVFASGVPAGDSYAGTSGGNTMGMIERVLTEGSGSRPSVVIELSRPSEYEVACLRDPPRIAVDLHDTQSPGGPQYMEVGGGLLNSIRWAQNSLDPMTSRVVLDLASENGELPDFRVETEESRVVIALGSGSPDEAGGRASEEEKSGDDPAAKRRLMDLAVRNAEVESILRMLSDTYGLNIISDGSLKGRVTTDLSGVDVEEALEAVLRAGGYRYAKQGDIIIAKERFEGKGDMVTKLFTLDYIDADAVKAACSRILSEEGIVESFSRSLLEKPDGYLDEDRIFRVKKDILLVMDYPDVVNMIDELVEVLDAAVPQVMIEVKFVETSVTEDLDLGIKWNVDAEFSGEPPVDPELQEQLGSSSIQLPNKTFEDGDFVFGQLKLHQFRSILQAIEQTGNAKLLSNPKIATLDNHEAQIRIGTKLLISQRERGLSGEIVFESFEELEVAIRLSVIPHVHENGDMTLQVRPMVEDIVGYTGQFQDRPIIAQRVAVTQVTVGKGETVVIGGLMKDAEIDTYTRVPLLGHIPLLKYLFTHKSTRNEKRDLIIFITPKLLTGEDRES